MADQRLLFVCGVQRSGTTALGQLLNRHPKIAIGIERYKALYSRIKSADELRLLFHTERFFRFEEGDTNLGVFDGKFGDVYSEMIDRYDDAVYVGDKYPSFYRKCAWIARTAPGARVVHIIRDPVEVAASWTQRARAGTWPSKNDHEAAVEQWNAGMRLALRWSRTLDLKLAFVRYEQIFFEGAEPTKRLLDWLELPMDDGLDQWLSTYQATAAKLAEARRIDPAIRAYVAERADWRTFETLRAQAL